MVRYNLELLKLISDRDKCKIDFDFYKDKMLNRNIPIDFICNCGIKHTRNFRMINQNAGGFCETCSGINRKKKQNKARSRYNYELLQIIINRDNCKVDLNLYKDQVLNQLSRIQFTCNCGIENSKGFQNLEKVGAFCKNCTYKIGREKFKASCLINYGVDNPTKSQKIRDKVKATLQSNYGVDTPLKSLEIKKRLKETNLEKYGVEYAISATDTRTKIKETMVSRYGVDNPLKVDSIKQKVQNTNLEKYGFISA